jgi:hypothetical protein
MDANPNETDSQSLGVFDGVCFNNRRLLELIGVIPPAEAEAKLLRQFASVGHGLIGQIRCGSDPACRRPHDRKALP